MAVTTQFRRLDDLDDLEEDLPAVLGVVSGAEPRRARRAKK
jgi:hypothetical protein